MTRARHHPCFVRDGVEPVGSAPEQSADHIRRERIKWATVDSSHMLMMEKNNLQIADLIQGWLERQDLYR
ncbi:MAG: hypothetical protein WKH97_19055 [Casimicrobiaceae bacterium]